MIFVLVVLTALDGSPILVESTQVQIIRVHSKECGPGAGAVVRIGSTTLCVKETQEEVRDKVKGNGVK